MSEMKFEDMKENSGTSTNRDTMGNMARTAVRGDIVQPLPKQQAANRIPASGAGKMGNAGIVQNQSGHMAMQSQSGNTAVQKPLAQGTATGLSLSQQQKLLKDMEMLQRRLEKEMLERRQLETDLAERNRKEREHLEEEAKKELERRDSKEIYTTNKVAISNWFLTICYLKIPIINIIYLLCTLISKKTPQPKKAYVLAWSVFQVLCLALAALLIYFVIQFGADFIDNMLKYIPH